MARGRLLGSHVRAAGVQRENSILGFESFLVEQRERVHALMAEFDARRHMREEDPFVREWETLELEDRK